VVLTKRRSRGSRHSGLEIWKRRKPIELDQKQTEGKKCPLRGSVDIASASGTEDPGSNAARTCIRF
jgi:hypothetical protein